MQSFNVADRIRDLCNARSWSLYRLAKESDIPYSTLSTMLNKTYAPSIPSLMKICDGFGITLSSFFSDTNDLEQFVKLSPDEKDCLSLWRTLDEKSQDLVLAYMQALLDRKRLNSKKHNKEDPS